MSKRRVDTHSSDEDLAEEDSDPSNPPAKRSKASKLVSARTLPVARASQIDDNGDEYWELNGSGSRRLTLNKFKGKLLVNIREYYEANGKWLPGKKGISMPIDQFSALVEILPQVEAKLQREGYHIPRPAYEAEPGKTPRHGQEADSRVERSEGSKQDLNDTSKRSETELEDD